MTTRLVDDLDGSDAVTTVTFALDGRGFEIDLSEGHLAELRSALEPFVTAARRVPGGTGSRRRTGRTSPRRASRRRSSSEAASAPAAAAPSPSPSDGESTVVDEPVSEESTAVDEPRSPPAGRTRAPLVADPFSPHVSTV